MSGKRFRVLPLTEYDAAGLTAAAAFQTITVAQKIPSEQFKDGILEARLHANSAQNLTLDVDVYPDGATDEDPSVQFIGSTSLANVQFDGNDVAGTFLSAQLTSGKVGSMLAVQVKLTATAAAATGTITISVDLNLID